MGGLHTFFDDVQRFANLRSRLDAEQIADAVLSVLAQRLSTIQAHELSAYLPLRAARAVTRSPVHDQPRQDLQALLQEVAALTETPDPADAEAHLGGVVVALGDFLPSPTFVRLLEAVPGAGEAITLHQGTRCLLCSPLPWTGDAAR